MPKTESNAITLGTKAADFILPDADGVLHRLEDFAGKPALLIVFLSNRCPFVIHIRDHLARFADEHAGRGLQVVGINANDHETHPEETLARTGEEAAAVGYRFPYLKDAGQEVAKSYGAACTPDFFLFDRNCRLVYHGQYDDARPGNDKPITGRDLRSAVEAVLEGAAIAQRQIPSIGCNIKWKAGQEPSWFSTAA